MSIRNKDAFMNALWDWGFLDNCFGNTRIRVSDLDGIVERNGEFLIIEAKGPGIPIPRGQSIMFSKMALKGMTVLIIWGEVNSPEFTQTWSRYKDQANPKREANVESIQKYVSRWFNWATLQKRKI